MRRSALACATVAAVVLLWLLAADQAGAQRFDPRTAAILTVGPPRGPAPTVRGDSRRTGATTTLLPRGSLRIAWRRRVGTSLDQAALAGAAGSLAVVSAARAEVFFFDEVGTQELRVAAGDAQPGGATITSDGTVVFTTQAGEFVGIRQTSPRPRFVTRVGGERNVRAAPLSLDDGGVVIATTTDLVALDSEGNERSRTSLPEAPAWPLLSTRDKVLAVSATGVVYGWSLAGEATRLGSFGRSLASSVSLVTGTRLAAVSDANEWVTVELGQAAIRSTPAQGIYLGPPSIGREASGSTLSLLFGLTPGVVSIVAIDPDGRETRRTPVTSLTPSAAMVDGGPAPLSSPLKHPGMVVDRRGAVAFGAPDGQVGVLDPDGSVATVSETLCSKSSRSSGIAGLTANGNSSFVVTCENGTIAMISGTSHAYASSGEAGAPLP